MNEQGMTDKQFKVFLRTLRWVVANCRSVDEVIEHINKLMQEL